MTQLQAALEADKRTRKAADPAKAYKTEYGTTSGPQSTDAFVDAMRITYPIAAAFIVLNSAAGLLGNLASATTC